MELWDARDKSGKKLGFTIEKSEILPDDIYHLGVDIWIKNSNDQYLIQRRALEKKRMPGMWMATGGSALSGEDGKTAACREVAEELGIYINKDDALRLFYNRHTSNFCEVFLVCLDVDQEDIIFKRDEVMDIRWVSFAVIEEMIKKNEMLYYSNDYLSALNKEIALDAIIIEKN